MKKLPKQLKNVLFTIIILIVAFGVSVLLQDVRRAYDTRTRYDGVCFRRVFSISLHGRILEWYHFKNTAYDHLRGKLHNDIKLRDHCVYVIL